MSFECDPHALEVLSAQLSIDVNWIIEPFALSDSSGFAEFNIWALGSGQSSLKRASESGPYFETIDTSEIQKTAVQTRRFDEVITSEKS